jgi:hypothetical protein
VSEASRRSLRDRAARAARRAAPYLPAVALSAVVGAFAVRAIREAAGAAAAPLDDAFIHLTFARGLAEGRFFSYVRGEGYSSGATSFVWPLLLAPFHLLGLRGQSLVWAAWLWGGLAHAGTTLEVYRLARRLAGRGAALGSAAISALFPAFAWFAWSGMETMALSWILLRTARVAAAYVEPERGAEPPPPGAVIAAALLAPLIRPEGALASLIGAFALLARPPRRRLLVLAPLVGPFLVPLLNLAFTGHAAASTTQVKWALGNPAYTPAQVLGLFLDNVRTLVLDVANGGSWTWIFLPENTVFALALALVALFIAGARRALPWHAVFVGMVAAGALIPCTYLSFLWNRLRYVWPFAGAWMVMLGCLARELGDLARYRFRRAVHLAPVLAGAAAAAVGMRLPTAVKDLANSARAIQKQQVELGHWARGALPASARVGVNDTGAIAYFGARPTFDICGLTTEGEARYWNAGAGSRWEHYEKLPRERLPTHFIVYPGWMSCPICLGKKLTEATVEDQSILGGVTMAAHEARWDLLGTGALPAHPPERLTLADEVDVSDLESEAAHGYAVGYNGDGDDHPRAAEIAGRTVADAGRARRTLDRFRVKIPAGKRARFVLRALPDARAELDITLGGRSAGALSLATEEGWAEPWLPVPDAVSGDVEVTVSVRAASAPVFSAYHYWIYAGP